MIREDFVKMIDAEGLFSTGHNSIQCRLCNLWAQTCNRTSPTTRGANEVQDAAKSEKISAAAETQKNSAAGS